jgi:hypothetical protein
MDCQPALKGQCYDMKEEMKKKYLPINGQSKRIITIYILYEGVSKRFRTGRLERVVSLFCESV